MKPATARRVRMILAIGGGTALVLLAALAMFPVSWVKGTVEDRLGRSIGSRVTIAALDRQGIFSFSPIIEASGIRMAQPDWAGRGDLATIRDLRLRLHVLPLLTGRFDADLLVANGLRLNLLRTAEGRENWTNGKDDGDKGETSAMAIGRIEDSVVAYRDDKQKRRFTLNLTVDQTKGLVAEGKGSIDGAPVRVTLRGAPMQRDTRWPFEATIDGTAIAMTAKGSMASPLRTDDMKLAVTARADDLKRIDRVIEAGLFGTQPVDLKADVTHADDIWTVENLKGRIGSSALTGRISAKKADGRTKLDGDVHFSRFSFRDLASDEGQRKAIVLRQQIGPRLVPNTRVNIRKIDKTDGRIAVRIDSIVSARGPSAVRSINAVLTLDDRILTVDPIRVGLRAGAITGRVVVDQRDGQPKPTVRLALALTDSRISAFSDGKQVDGRIDGRFQLTGVGDTLREAVGASDGRIGLLARQGALPTKIAALMGFDVARGLLAGDEDRETLRCGALGLSVKHGLGTIDPLLIDTSISQSRGSGTVRFPDETLALTLTGQPKGKAAIRLPGSVRVTGTIRDPKLILPQDSKSVGNILKALGRAITGKQGPRATDADCAALTARMLN